MENVKLTPFKIIGISVRTTNENGQAAHEIASLWSKFMNEDILRHIPNKIDNTVYSLYTDYESDHTKPYTALLGCKVKSLDAIPEGMFGKTIGGGNYIKIKAKGDLTQGLIVKEWSKIWEMDLERTFTTDFEVFEEKAQDPKAAEVDFFVAIKQPVK